MGARAARSHTGALAGNDKIYDAVLRQCGVIRAYSLNDMLEFARGLQILPTPKGENVVIVTGAGGSGVLLSDACVDNWPAPHEHACLISTRPSKNSSRLLGRLGIRSTSRVVSHRRPTAIPSNWRWTTSAFTPSFSATGTPLLRRLWCLPPC